MRYEHIQSAPLYLLLLLSGLGMNLGACFVPDRTIQIVFIASGIGLILLAGTFKHLAVRDNDDHLLIAFGPLPLFRRRIRFSQIERFEATRSSILDGWGIHLSLSGGWTWNLWGFDCVDVWYNNGRKIRIGTDDPEGLVECLKERCSIV